MDLEITGFWTGDSNRPEHGLLMSRPEMNLQRGYHLIIGGRQTGKTTILKYLIAKQKEKDHNAPAAYVSLEDLVGIDGLSSSEFTQKVVGMVATSLDQPALASHSTYSSFLRSLPPDTTLALDEFNHLAKFPNLFHALRSLAEDHRFHQKPTVFLADRTHPFDYMEAAASPWNIGEEHYLCTVSPEEVALFVRVAFESNNVSVTDGVIERIYSQTGGQPYLVNRVGIELVKLYYAGQEINLDSVDKVANKLYDDLDIHFRHLRNVLPRGDLITVAGKLYSILDGREVPFFRYDLGVLESHGVVERKEDRTGHVTAIIPGLLYQRLVKEILFQRRY